MTRAMLWLVLLGTESEIMYDRLRQKNNYTVCTNVLNEIDTFGFTNDDRNAKHCFLREDQIRGTC